MITQKTIYETSDGTRFDDYGKASEYDKLDLRVSEILGLLQSPCALRMRECVQLDFPTYKMAVDKAAEIICDSLESCAGKREVAHKLMRYPQSWLFRNLDDLGTSSPLRKLMVFQKIDGSGILYDQPYYRINGGATMVHPGEEA